MLEQHSIAPPSSGGPLAGRTFLLNSMLTYLLPLNSLRNIVFILFILRYVRKTFYSLRGYGIFGSIRNVYASVRLFFYSVFLRFPGVRGQVDKQVSTAIEGLESKLIASGPGVTRYLNLPKEGWTAEQVRAELDKLANMEHTRWEDGRVSGAVYHGGQDLLKLQAEAFGQFGVANPIHPDVFPGVRKMEAEVVAMVIISWVCDGHGLTRHRLWRCSMLRLMVQALLPVAARSRLSWHAWVRDRRLSLNEV